MPIYFSGWLVHVPLLPLLPLSLSPSPPSLPLSLSLSFLLLFSLPPFPTHAHNMDDQKMNALAVKFGPLWLHLVAILTTSCQNQHSLVERRGASHILSCMHLSILSSSLDFQHHGWTALGNIIGTPVQPGQKVCGQEGEKAHVYVTLSPLPRSQP